MQQPHLIWDWGTAYDLFVSLHILHHPADYALRAAWAAGMRSRLPAPERELLERVYQTRLHAPLIWIYNLPGPKNGLAVLQALESLSPRERIAAMSDRDALRYELPRVFEIVEQVAERRAWNEDDVEAMRDAGEFKDGKGMPRKEAIALLDLWAFADEYGEGLLSALRAYYEVFFAEEERRIQPALETGLAHAQALAQTLDIDGLIEKLSQGVRFADATFLHTSRLVLVPSFWITPWISWAKADPDQVVMIFGARPESASLVPGEVVPEGLVRALKALSDPTRLRILRYLSAKPLNPTQLARRLRLRTPTVFHHLHELRNAGLVFVTVEGGEGRGDKTYQAHHERIQAICGQLEDFLAGTDESAHS